MTGRSVDKSAFDRMLDDIDSSEAAGCDGDDRGVPITENYSLSDYNFQDLNMEMNTIQDNIENSQTPPVRNSSRRIYQRSIAPPLTQAVSDAVETRMKARMYHRHSTLGYEEEMALRKIAMPDEIHNGNQCHEIREIMSDHATDDQIVRFPRKRQKIESSPSLRSTTTESNSENIQSKIEDPEYSKNAARTKKQGHNAIEKRYRSRLNARITSLEQCIPKLDLADDPTTESHDGEYIPRRKITKSAVLGRALDHIRDLESRIKVLVMETSAMHVRIAAFEQLVFARKL